MTGLLPPAMSRLSIAGLLLLAPVAAQSQPVVVANYVRGLCETENKDCFNYLLGVKEGLAFAANWHVCFADAKTGQLRLAFLLYASKHRDELTQPAVQMAAKAFAAAFPCPGQSDR